MARSMTDTLPDKSSKDHSRYAPAASSSHLPRSLFKVAKMVSNTAHSPAWRLSPASPARLSCRRKISRLCSSREMGHAANPSFPIRSSQAWATEPMMAASPCSVDHCQAPPAEADDKVKDSGGMDSSFMRKRQRLSGPATRVEPARSSSDSEGAAGCVMCGQSRPSRLDSDGGLIAPD